MRHAPFNRGGGQGEGGQAKLMASRALLAAAAVAVTGLQGSAGGARQSWVPALCWQHWRGHLVPRIGCRRRLHHRSPATLWVLGQFNHP
jgi:hypothetical protein